MTLRRAAFAAALLVASCTSPDEEELYLPTEEEARAKAEADINEQNADAEFDKLMEEIEAERR